MTSFKQFRANFKSGEVVHFNVIPNRARPFQGKTVGFTSRFISVLIDMALIAVLLAGAYGIWVALRYVLGVFYDIPQLSGIPLLAVGYFLMWAYWTWSWATGGKSLGNVLMGLRVQANSGQSLRLGRSAARSLLSVIFPIGLAWAIVNRNNHSVQDVILRTQVVFDWTPLVSIEDQDTTPQAQ
jgi:uncharacterized RDD family membrane protein YckC